MFVYAEAVLGPSHMPAGHAPLAAAEFNKCTALVAHTLGNQNTTDVLAMLLETYQVESPVQLGERLAKAIQKSLVDDSEDGGDADHRLGYWNRIANTYSMILVLEAINRRSAGANERQMEMAVDHFDTAVEYAQSMDRYHPHRKNLICLLNHQLGYSNLYLTTFIKLAWAHHRDQGNAGH